MSYKTLAVADAFMKPEFYEACFDKNPDYDLQQIIFFGEHERKPMREPFRLIEREGPDAVEPPQELYKAVEDAEILMVHMCPVNRKVIEHGKNLKAILTNRGGTENVDLKAAAEHGIPVLNNPAHNANSVAELTIGLMLAETRNIARTHACLKKGEWSELFVNRGKVRELHGLTIGIIGFGNIGRRVARKLTVFDCNVLVYDKFVPADDPDLAKYGCTFVDLPTLMSQSDIVTLHVRSDDLILDGPTLRLMKEGAYFINTARPHMVDNETLAELLRNHYLMGAAFDVFSFEPAGLDDLFVPLDNTTVTNHRGGDTVNCYSDSPAMLLEQANVMFAGGQPRFFANEKYMKKA